MSFWWGILVGGSVVGVVAIAIGLAVLNKLAKGFAKLIWR